MRVGLLFASKEFEKEYLASIELAGGVNLKVRLIPNMEIKFYKVALAGLSIEPWATGNLKATAISELKTDFENYDFLGVHKMEKLDIDVGIDANVYADLSIWKINLAHYPSGGGKKTIFEPSWKIFSLPEIKLSSSSENSCEIKADITDGVNNKLENLSWFIFPDYGATITPNGSDSARLNFDEDGEYEVYLVGNSDVLGEYFGKKYKFLLIDSNKCKNSSSRDSNNIINLENKWKTPSKSTCNNNGGYYYDNHCSANWENANKICNAIGYVLPNNKILEEIVTSCGGNINIMSPYENNDVHQICYEEKGFTPNFFWTSTTSSDDTSYAGVIDFYYGFYLYFIKTNEEPFIKCLKK